MNTFIQNIALISDKLPENINESLQKLSEINDPDDHIKKLFLKSILECKYILELDWLYSTLHGQLIEIK
jgi:hypothetical protein